MQEPIKYEVLVGDRDIPADACSLGLFDSVEEAEDFIAITRVSLFYSDRLYFEIHKLEYDNA